MSFDYMAYMDYMDPAVGYPKKAIKLKSITHPLSVKISQVIRIRLLLQKLL